MSDHNLIVDVGMHRGDDTAFYLAKGFRVVAVEADPGLVELGRERFAQHLASGNLEIVHMAVADTTGMLLFHTSTREGWGSLDPARAGGSLGADVRSVEVRADTFDNLMKDYPTPYFVKIDIEGADAMCVEGLCRMGDVPRFVSFEADLAEPATCTALIDRLSSVGYRRFKVINQALNPTLVPPNPPREGTYVPAAFTHEMSGLFGLESPGEWCDAAATVENLQASARQQRIRTEYAATGRVWGIPLGRAHGHVQKLYNTRPVKAARAAYASARGQELGGWFDVHACLDD